MSALSVQHIEISMIFLIDSGNDNRDRLPPDTVAEMVHALRLPYHSIEAENSFDD